MVLCSRFVMICSCNCTIAGSPSVFKTIFVLPVSRMLCSTFLRQFQVGFPLFLSSVWVFTYTSFYAHRTPSSVRQMHCPMFFLFLWRGFRGIPGPPGGSLFVGRPHFQRECPHASAGKGNYPITTTWSSWRPGTFPGPPPAQWNSWLPKPKEKGKGKGKKQRRQRRFERQRKRTRERDAEFWELTSGTTARLVELCTCCPF